MFIFHNANKLNEFAKSKELIKNVHVNIITVLVYTNYKKINTFVDILYESLLNEL